MNENKTFSLVVEKNKVKEVLEDYNDAQSALYAFFLIKTTGKHCPQNSSGDLVDLVDYDHLTIEVDVEFDDGTKSIGEELKNHISYLA